ncbi:MAG: hypothetical protein RLY86_1163 [Pseudomonadota bacterium]|jgi:hypothetical protein
MGMVQGMGAIRAAVRATLLAAGVILATTTLPTGAGAADALPGTAAVQARTHAQVQVQARTVEAGARHLLILARDGAFGGNLGALAGLPLALDRGDAGVRDVLTALTDDHGWLERDRAGWQAMDLGEAARRVQRGQVAALVLLADPADPRLTAALAGGRFRLIDLGDGVSRAHAQTAGLEVARVGQRPGLTAGATTLVLDPGRVQVADRTPRP